jgi:hypothetical protein
MTISDKIVLRVAEAAKVIMYSENPEKEEGWAEYDSAMQELYRRADRIKELETENERLTNQAIGS